MPLTRVGRYRLADVLGVGMFSRVVVGVDDETGERYAIKVMNKRRLEELNMDQYARREAVVLHRVRHPNLVQFVEAIQSPKKLFLVMQIAPGRELLDVVKEGPVPESDARVYMRQLVDAVACLHEHSYAHRDIKPSNVLVDTETKKLTLIDLGLAGVIRRYNPMQTRCGSDFYKAPETLQSAGFSHSSNNTYDGIKNDAWAVGALAYILLTGTHPFVDRFGQLMIDNLRTAKLEFPQSMSSSSVSFVSCLLQLSPRKRSTVAAIRSHQWLSPEASHSHLSSGSIPTSSAFDFTSKRPRGSRVGMGMGGGGRGAGKEHAARGSRGVQLAKILSISRINIGGGSDGRDGRDGDDASTPSIQFQDRRDRESADRRRSKGSTSSFLWFRRNVHDEYAEDMEASRSFAHKPKLSREIPISIRKSVDILSEFPGANDERERSMSIVGQAWQSFTAKIRPDRQHPRMKSDAGAAAHEHPDSQEFEHPHSQAFEHPRAQAHTHAQGYAHEHEREKQHPLQQQHPPPPPQAQAQAPPYTHSRQHQHHPHQTTKQKPRASHEGVRVARHMSAVFTKARKFAQSKSVNSAV